MVRKKQTSTLELEAFRDAFMSRVEIRGEDECWPWLLSRNSFGHGQFSASGWPWLAHRLMWIYANGRLPGAAYICHTCDNPWCCNPAHLYDGSPTTNMRDCRNRKRWKRVKLSPEQVIEIAESGEPVKVLAQRFGVGSSCITNIKHGVTWSDLTAGRINLNYVRLDQLPRDVARTMGYTVGVAA